MGGTALAGALAGLAAGAALFGWRGGVSRAAAPATDGDADPQAGGEAGAVDRMRMMRRDPLTALGNRYWFDEILAQRLAGGRPFSVLLLDIDGFRHVNDSLGFRAGDLILQQVADRLRHAAPHPCQVAHLFSDDFGLLVDGAHQDAEAFTLRLLRIFEAPFYSGGDELALSASVGIALGPEDGADSGALLLAANRALRGARATGHGNWMVYNAAAEGGEHDLLSLLPGALERGDIVPYFQPIIDAGSGCVAGLEVLARWQHPELGLLMPRDFIGLADGAALLDEVTRALLRGAGRAARAWPATLFLSFNVAPSQLAGLAALVDQLPGLGGLPPARLAFELTGASPVADMAAARDVVEALRAQGVRLVLDNFGGNTASLPNVLGMTFDGLKIDRGFVSKLVNDTRAERLVQSIVTGAASLGMDVTASGVATQDVAARVRALGCRFMQGAVFGMPVAERDVAAMLARLDQAAPPKMGGWRTERAAARA